MASPEGLVEETVRVTSVQGDWITIEKLADSAPCAGCAQACPSAFLNRLQRGSANRWQIPIQHEARPGDVWQVGIDPAVLLRGAVRVYVLPLAGLLTGAILGNSLAGDTGSALGGLTGLALLLCWSRFSRPPPRELTLVFIKKIHSA